MSRRLTPRHENGLFTEQAVNKGVSVFSLFKRSLPLKVVVSDFADTLNTPVADLLKEAKRTGAVPESINWDKELLALTLTLSWYAVVMSKLPSDQKPEFVELLIRELFQRSPNLAMDFETFSRFMKGQLAQYIHATDHGTGRDHIARIVFHFLKHFGLGEYKDAALYFSLYTVATKSAVSDVKFLNNISEQFKLTL